MNMVTVLIKQSIEVADVLRGRKLTTLAIGVPNAAADEGIANAILRGSGIDAAIANTGDPVTATDILARIGSGPAKGVDAQRQFNPDRLKSICLIICRQE